MGVAVDRWAGAGEVGTLLTDWSPSRLSTAAQCGRKFELQYVRGIPAAYESGALMLGTAVHNGVQAWYELPDEGPAHGFQVHDLAPVICAQWEAILPPVVWGLVQELRELDAECDAVAAAVLFRRPELKAPRTTVDFLRSDASKAFNGRRAAMLELCDKLPEAKWPRDEDPYQAYRRAAEWGDQMQRRWQHLPPPLVVEYPFSLELFGFRCRGRIDAVRVDPMPPHGLALPTVLDYKTSRQPLTQMEAFLQMFIYYKAVEAALELPTTERIAFYLTRKNAYQQGRIDPERHSRLAYSILHGKARQIAMGQFEPSFGHWCKRCDFHDVCESELQMWVGDGLTAELML